MSGLQFFVAVFPVLIPVAILILIFSIIQIIKDRYFYDYFWNERFKEKAKRLIGKTIFLKEYKNIHKHFSESTRNIIIKENGITMASKLIAKIENCSNSKLNAKKRAMWSEFLMGTISNIGQPTNTGSIMEQVSNIAGSGGGLGSLSSLGAIASQFLGNQ